MSITTSVTRMRFRCPSRDASLTSRTTLAADNLSSTRSEWLLTGDSKLNQIGRPNAWLRFYDPVKDHIGTMILPHHGSHLTFHRDLLKAVHEDAVVAACCLEKSSRDPLHENVGHGWNAGPTPSSRTTRTRVCCRPAAPRP
jgi:hypothetical protein